MNYEFEILKTLASRSPSQPKFIFAHILLPHPPFVFDRNGYSLPHTHPFTIEDGNHYHGSSNEYRQKYLEQLTYGNKKILETLDAILANSKTPPIIILQSDHGPGAFLDWESIENTCLKERVSILNAYYLPEGGKSKLYPEITPVNTFRLIFDTFFGTDFGQLENRSYYSPWRYPYQFTDVTQFSQNECTIDSSSN